MNAPWKSGGGNGRDQFAAYICDEASLDVLRPVAMEMGWQPEKCNKGGLRNAVQSLSITASPHILHPRLSAQATFAGSAAGLALAGAGSLRLAQEPRCERGQGAHLHGRDRDARRHGCFHAGDLAGMAVQRR